MLQAPLVSAYKALLLLPNGSFEARYPVEGRGGYLWLALGTRLAAPEAFPDRSHVIVHGGEINIDQTENYWIGYCQVMSMGTLTYNSRYNKKFYI